MNRSLLITIIGAVLLIAACLMPWMRIEDPAITISGVDTAGTRYGKPALTHFILVGLILLCSFIPRVWAKRVNLLFAALNLAWGIRNFGVITRCEGGVCPEKLLGIYLLLLACIVLMITALFPNEPKIKTGDLNID
ncbi:hypothetical protein [Niabella ginsengisoli]|uniref:Uncharacterized protein n=1 Tax=Niabella ginsengisoli TaxID=522298 RepID=A0ABS9SFW3_9BACT|nr:hypothetical protein [Niabella ginsengisoli]MCH5597243.1 hypothetical protein [Niabella ginsengisoli]